MFAHLQASLMAFCLEIHVSYSLSQYIQVESGIN